MDALLRWGIENSSQGSASAAPAGPREPLDPAIIDHILGKSDADQMKVGMLYLYASKMRV